MRILIHFDASRECHFFSIKMQINAYKLRECARNHTNSINISTWVPRSPQHNHIIADPGNADLWWFLRKEMRAKFQDVNQVCIRKPPTITIREDSFSNSLSWISISRNSSQLKFSMLEMHAMEKICTYIILFEIWLILPFTKKNLHFTKIYIFE